MVGKRILLAEGNWLLRDAYSTVLERRNYSIERVTNGK